jgi:hypothetical protein
MSIATLLIKDKAELCGPYELDFFHATQVFRSLGVVCQFGIIPSTHSPILPKAPLDIPSVSPFVCFYGRAWLKPLDAAHKIFSKIHDRLLAVRDSPAHPNEFDVHQLLASESVGHEVRCLACFEEDSVKRAALLEKAYSIYEGVVLVCCHSSVNAMLNTISKGSSKAFLFQPFKDMERFTPEGRRLVSHSFAGMAVCALMGEGTIAKFISLVSAAVCWDAQRPLELAGTLRMLPLIMGKADLLVNPIDVVDSQTFLVLVAKTRSTTEMFNAVTDNILLPAMLRLGRRDLFDYELLSMHADRRVDCERFAHSVERHRVTTPSSLRTVRSHVVDGQIIERVCAACGIWDGTAKKKFMRCSGCDRVYYCGKQCQLAHWKGVHKAVCVKK